MENAALYTLIELPWYIPLQFVRNIFGKQALAQGTGKHTPQEVKHIGELDLDALGTIIGNSQ